MLRDQPLESQEAAAAAPAAGNFQHRQLAAQIAKADRAAVAHAIPTPPAPRALGGTTLSGQAAGRSQAGRAPGPTSPQPRELEHLASPQSHMHGASGYGLQP